MKVAVLQELGLTESQSAAYVTLLKNSPCTPPALAKLIAESRTNTYKILNVLEDLELVERDESGVKLLYWANNPSVLLEIAEKKRREAENVAKRTETGISALMSEYYEHTIRPSVQFKNGRRGIEETLEDYAKNGSNLYLIRTWKDREFMRPGTMSILRKIPSTHGLLTHIIAPDTKSASMPELDALYLFDKTWITEEDYSAPVEWCAYGDKLAIISYGEEAVTTIIKSKQVAEGFKQLFRLLAKKQRESKDYSVLPQKARLADDSVVAETKNYKEVVKARQRYIQKYGPEPISYA